MDVRCVNPRGGAPGCGVVNYDRTAVSTSRALCAAGRASFAVVAGESAPALGEAGARLLGLEPSHGAFPVPRHCVRAVRRRASWRARAVGGGTLAAVCCSRRDMFRSAPLRSVHAASPSRVRGCSRYLREACRTSFAAKSKDLRVVRRTH
jgi:hypothetical protein